MGFLDGLDLEQKELENVNTAQAVAEKGSFLDGLDIGSQYELDFKRDEAERIFDYVSNNFTDEQADDLIPAIDYWRKFYNTSAEDILTNFPQYAADYFKDIPAEKSSSTQLADALRQGFSTVRRGTLGRKLANAGDEATRNILLAEIEKIDAEMPNPEGDQKSGPVSWLSAGLSQAGIWFKPFCITVLTSLIPQSALVTVAGRLAPYLRAGMGFATTALTSAETEGGNLYVDMIRDGIPADTAKKYSMKYGAWAGLVEAVGFEVFINKVPAVKKIMSGGLAKLARRDRMKMGIVKAITTEAKKNAIPLLISGAAEMAEEGVQGKQSQHFSKKADLESIEDRVLRQEFEKEFGELKGICREDWKNYYNNLGPEEKADVDRKIQELRTERETYYSSDEYFDACMDEIKTSMWEAFKGTVTMGGGFTGVSIVSDVVRSAEGVNRYKKAAEEVQSRDEVKKGLDKAREDLEKKREAYQQTGTEEARKAYEEEVENVRSQEEKANFTDLDKEYADLLAIRKEREWNEDELDRYVYLSDVIQAREDRIVEQAEENPDYEKQPEDIEILEPQTQEVGEQRYRESIRAFTPKVTDTQADAIIHLMELKARAMGQDLDTYMKNTFQAQMAQLKQVGDLIEYDRQGSPVYIAAEDLGLVQFDKDGKAIITLTKNADFSTWVHELGHIFRRQIGGELLADAERYYEVQGGVWTRAQEERFTEDFTDFLMTGYAPTAGLKSLFRIMADTLRKIFLGSGNDVSEDIAKVFRRMLESPDGAYAQTSDYSYDEESTLYQVLGQRGARALDIAEGVTTRMDNLEKAKDYQSRDKGRHIIRYATGWELGDDGNWKYETNDIQIKDTEADKALKEKSRQYNSIYDRYETLSKIPAFERTEEQTQELRAINKQLKVINKELNKIWKQRDKEYSQYIGKSDLPIETFVEADEVFKAYPQLKDIKVHIMNDEEIEGYSGWYDAEKNEIAINEKNLLLPQKDLQKTFAHEIQHVIQDIEGFAPGGNEGQFTTADLGDIEKKVNKMPKGEDRKRLKEAIRVLKKNTDNDYVDLTEFGIPGIVTPFEAYMRLAGEVEARNVEARLDFTPEQRRLILLADTADYDKAGQIFLERGGKTASRQPDHTNLLFQKAYHGSGANFDAFSTEHIGEGEGAQAYGWGIYLTQSHGIAESYAEKLRKKPSWSKKGNALPAEEQVVLNDFLTLYYNYYSTIEEAKDRYVHDLEWHKKSSEDELKDAKKLVDIFTENYENGRLFAPEKRLKTTSDILASDIANKKHYADTVRMLGPHAEPVFARKLRDAQSALDRDTNTLETVRNINFEEITFEKSKRNLYTVSIPDDSGSNYLKWDKIVPQDQSQKMLDAILKTQKPTDNDWGSRQRKWFGDKNKGAETYKWLEIQLGSDKAASEFLNSIGFVGIDYPANATTGGNRYGKRNFVIFNDKDIQIDNHTLWQKADQTYQRATENGQYVPDDILERFRGREWADAEIQARIDYRRETAEHDSYEQFLEYMTLHDTTRTDDYYEKIWNSATDIFPEYKEMLPLLSRRMVERILKTLKGMSERKGDDKLKLEYPWKDLVKNYSKDHMMSEDDYRALMAKMTAAPDEYIKMIADCFSDQAEFEEMMKSLWLHPDLEIERIKELERAIRGDQATAKTTFTKLKARIAELKSLAREERLRGDKAERRVAYLEKLRQAQRTRDIYNRLVRVIFKRPPKMCDVEIAMEIQAIQAGLSPTSMRDTTRQRLLAELGNTTDEKRKNKILSLLNRKSLREMTLEEVAEIAAQITEMRHEGVAKRMDQLLTIKEERLDTAEGLKEDLGNTEPLDKTGSNEARNDKGSLVDRMKGFWWDINRIARDMGKHWESFFGDKVGQAYQDELRNFDRRRTALINEMESLGITAKTLAETEEINGNTYSHDILLHWYLCMQNADSYVALVFGNFQGNPENTELMDSIDRTLQEGVSKLSDAEIELAEWMMDSFAGEDRGRLWETYIKVENRCPEMVVRYFPMIRQRDKYTDVQADPLVDLGERTPAGRVAVRKGFSWNRLHNISWQHQQPLRLGAMSTYLQAIQDQEHYIAFAQLSKDMKYIYSKVSDQVISKYGRVFYQDINEWIDRVINPNAYKARYNRQNIFLEALSNSVAAALAGNVVTMIKQAPSMLFFLPYCDIASIARSISDFASDHEAMTKFAKEKSPYLANRNIDDMLTKLRDQLNDPNTKLRGVKEFTNAMLKPISWIDEFACVVGWNAVYAHEMSNGATEEDAVKRANEALLKTQPQATAIYSPQAYNAGDFWRPFLVFTRQANQIWQMMTADMPNLAKEREFKRLIAMGMVLGLNAFVMGWIARKFAGYGDDDKSAAEDIRDDIITNIANNIPIIGPTLVAMMQRSVYTSSGYVNPLSDMLSKGFRAYRTMVDKENIDFDTAMRYITDAMGPFGLPKVLTWRAYKALKEQDIWYLFIGSPLGGKKNGGK